jgi:hypothetical protein
MSSPHRSQVADALAIMYRHQKGVKELEEKD